MGWLAGLQNFYKNFDSNILYMHISLQQNYLQQQNN